MIEGYLAHKWDTASLLPDGHAFKNHSPTLTPTLKTATTFDYESNASSYSIRVQAKDEYNATVEQTFTVYLSDVYEPSLPNHVVDLNASVNLEMIWVEPGTFTMGSPLTEANRSSDETEHNVHTYPRFLSG